MRKQLNLKLIEVYVGKTVDRVLQHGLHNAFNVPIGPWAAQDFCATERPFQHSCFSRVRYENDSHPR